MLITGTERKREQDREKIGNESVGEGQTINCRKTECMVASSETDQDENYKLRDSKTKKVQKSKYTGRVLTSDEKCDAEIQTGHWNSK